MKFEIYRILLHKNELPLSIPTDISRENFIKMIFEDDLEFDFKNYFYSYKKIHSESGYILSCITKKKHKQIIDKNLQTNSIDHYEPIIAIIYPKEKILIDTGREQEGQLLALEVNKDFGGSQLVLNEISKKIQNSGKFTDYTVQINKIIDDDDFERVFKNNLNNISKIAFTYSAPNLFGVDDEIEKQSKLAKEQCNANELEYAVKNEEEGCLKITEEGQVNILRTFNKISKGAGKRFYIKAIDGQTIYDTSNKSKKVANLMVDEISEEKLDNYEKDTILQSIKTNLTKVGKQVFNNIFKLNDK